MAVLGPKQELHNILNMRLILSCDLYAAGQALTLYSTYYMI